jgi:hypothetical protein
VLSPTVTASKTDSLFTDVDGDLQADPGDTLQYSVNINASGDDANGVSLTDTVDPNTTFVPGSLTATPVAVDDSYSALGNVRISVPAPGVLGDDFAGVPSATITGAPTLSANGGNVALNADGSFTYNPPAGFEGTDTFTYTLTNASGSNSATVTITVNGMIWFINNTASCPCDGRLTNPFNTLAAFAAVNNGTGNNPAANDNIFLYESAVNYVGSLTLLNGQRFIGQDATASLSTITGLTPPIYSDPLPATNSANATIVNITSASTAITVASGNTLVGFTGGDAVTDISGAGFGTLTISDVTLNGIGQALNLTTGTLAATFGSISSTNSATTGISLTSVAGSLTSPTNTITNPTGIGIGVSTSSASLNFGNTTSTGSGGTGVSLLTNTGTITFGALDISPDANQRGLLATENSNTITSTSGTIGTNGAAAVEVTRSSGTTPLAISLTSVSTNGGPNGILLSNTSGSFTVTGNSSGFCGGQVSGSPLSITTAPNASDCTGGRIQLTTGANGATSGTGIRLSNATNVLLTRMRLDNHTNFAVQGSLVTGFTLSNSLIDGVNGSTTAPDEGSINITNLLGTSSITNSTVRGGFEDNIQIINNTGTGTLTISGSTIRDNSTSTGNDGVFGQADPSATLTIKVINSVLQRNRGDHVNTNQSGNGVINTVVTGNTMTFNGTIGDPFDPVTTAGGSVTLTTGGNFTGTSTFNVSNNNITGARTSPININNTALTSTPGGIFSGTLSGNTIGKAGAVGSGSDGNGIDVTANGNANITVTITNNNVRQWKLLGLNLVPRDGAATMNATVTGNTIGEPFDAINSAQAILFNGGPATTETGNSCVDIGGAGALANSFPGTFTPGVTPLRVRQRAVNTVFLPGYLGGNTNTAAVNAYLSGRNNAVATSSTVNSPPGGGFQNTPGGNPCTAGAMPTLVQKSDTSSSEALLAVNHEAAEGGSVQANEDTLFAARGEAREDKNVARLTQVELSASALAAIERWREAGISVEDLMRLQAVTFEITDLPDGQLATITSTSVKIDETAAGYGWYSDLSPMEDSEFDVPVPNRELQTTEFSPAFGRIDLLTAVVRELGLVYKQGKKNLPKQLRPLMEPTLSPAVRRLPDSRIIQLRRASAGVSGMSQLGGEKSLVSQAGKALTFRPKRGVSDSGASMRKVGSNSEANQAKGQSSRLMHHAPMNRTTTASLSSMVADVMLNIGTLPAGESVAITFKVTVDDPFTGALPQVSNQGTVSGSNFSDVLTDDPSVGGTADPTVTPIDISQVTLAVSPASVLEDGATNLVYTFTRTGSTANPMTVNFSVGGTASFTQPDYTQTGAATFTASSGTVVIPSGSSTATVTVDPSLDLTVEPDETVVLTVTTGTGYSVGSPSGATGTITNDDTDVSVAVSPGSVAEDGATNLVYTFSRTGVTSSALTVNFSVGGTASFGASPNDYTQTGAATFSASAGTVTFTAGSSTATVTINPETDSTVEPDETVDLTVTSGAGYNVGSPSAASGTITNDDTDVSVAVSPGSVAEDGATNLVYTFTRNGVTSGALTVNFSVGGTATFGGSPNDYTQTGATSFTPPTGTVTFGAGSSTATVTINPEADTTVEPDETVDLTVTAGTGYNVGAPASASGTITNDDTDVSVAVSPGSVAEDGVTNLVYTFSRTGVTSSALTVNFSVGGSANFGASPNDYTQTGAASFTPSAGTVTFAAGSSTATVTIDPEADSTVEPDETVDLTVTAGAGYNVGAPASASGTITNDDTNVSVAVSPGSVAEDGATNLVYTFTRSGVTSGALTVNFSVGGTANFGASPNDYTQTGATSFTPPTGTATFGAGSSTATVTINPEADSTVEPDETVNLTVIAGAGYNVGSPSSATGTITNDDTDVTLAVSPGSVAEDGATNLVYTFTRNGVTTNSLTVNFSVGGSASFGVSPNDYTQTGATSFTPPTGTVTFAAGSSTATVTIDPEADSTVESDETVDIAVTAGAGYNVGSPNSATGTITNDDTDVTLAVSPSSVSEDGATNLVYTFTRTGATAGPLTVNFSIGGSANFGVSPNDYTQTGATTFTPPTGTVTFGAGNSTATVTINPESDTTVETDETVILTLTSGAGYNVGSPNSATGTITNDDSDVSVAVSPASVAEDGATNLVYTFTRTGFTGGALTVNFSVGGTANFGVSPNDYTQTGATSFTPPTGTVTFGAGNSTATVTINPEADTTVETDETVILTLTPGAGYNVGSPSSATGTITNDDANVSVAVAPSSVVEDGAANLVYTFTRMGFTANAVTVNFSVGGTAVFSQPDYSQTGAATFTDTSGTVNFGPGSSAATVTIDPTADLTAESDETVVLTVTAGTGYNVGSPSSATGTILNDDPFVEVVFSSTRDGNFEIYGMLANGTGVTRLTNNTATDLDPALSLDKTKILFTSDRDGNLEIYSMNVNGTGVTRLTNNSAVDGFAAWSPAGTQIVFTSTRDGNFEIYSMNSNGTGVTRLTINSATDANPAWSPSGTRIAFTSTRHGNVEIYSMNVNGTGVTRLTNDEDEDAFPSWSPDSLKIAFMSTRPGNAEIYSMNANGSGVTRLTNNSAIDAEPAWGTNGKIAFSSTRDGNFEIYSMNANGTGLLRLTNNVALDTSPHW